MRRSVVAALIVAALGLSLPAVAVAARPVYEIQAITVTADGGTWPMCRQTVAVTYSAGHRAGWIVAYAWKDGMHSPYEFAKSFARIDYSGVVTTSTIQDVSSYPDWGWTAYVADRNQRMIVFDPGVQTSLHTFVSGSCPSSGVIATYP